MCCLGPGAPSAVNTVIGRAMRLILMNIAGAYPGVTDKDTIGSANKYSMCLAENEEANPWEPLHVERGYSKEESTVTVASAASVFEHSEQHVNPEELVRGMARPIASNNCSGVGNWMIRPHKNTNSRDLKPEEYREDCHIILAPNHARLLGDAGWNKAGVKEMLHLFARTPIKNRPGTKPGLILAFAPGTNERVRPSTHWLHDHPELEVPV